MKKKIIRYIAVGMTAAFIGTSPVSVAELFGDRPDTEALLSEEAGENGLFSSDEEEDEEEDDFFEEEEKEKTITQDGLHFRLSGHEWILDGYTEELQGKEEIVIPEKLEGEYVYVSSRCFQGLTSVKYLTVPGKVEIHLQGLFDSWEGITIRCPLNSPVSESAKLLNISQDNSMFVPWKEVKENGVGYFYLPETNTYRAYMSMTKDGPFPENIVYEKELNGCPVTELNTKMSVDKGYREGTLYFPSIKSVYIPNSVQFIAKWEFSDAKCWQSENGGFVNLKKVTIEDGDKPLELEDLIFDNCPSLEEVNFPSRLSVLPRNLFRNCPALKRMELPTGLKTIEHYVFYGAPNLEALHIPSTVTYIEDTAVQGLNKLTIYGEKGSYAENYAKRLGVSFIPLKDGEKMPQKRPPASTTLKASVSGSKVTFTWKEAKNADGYQIYRFDIENGKYKRLKTITSGKTLKYTKSLSVLDKGRFKIRAYSEGKDGRTYGTFSPTIMIEGKPLTPALKWTVRSLGSSDIRFSWNQTALADGYQIYCYNSSKKAYSRMKTITDREITQYVKTMKFASNGRYKIRAFCKKADGTRIYGSFGSPIEVKVPTEAPRINYISAEYRKALVINWNRPKGAEGYIIERGVSGTGAFKTVATIKNPSTLTYKDKNLKPGQRYYYKITAIRKTADGKISKSKPSPVKNWKCV